VDRSGRTGDFDKIIIDKPEVFRKCFWYFQKKRSGNHGEADPLEFRYWENDFAINGFATSLRFVAVVPTAQLASSVAKIL